MSWKRVGRGGSPLRTRPTTTPPPPPRHRKTQCTTRPSGRGTPGPTAPSPLWDFEVCAPVQVPKRPRMQTPTHFTPLPFPRLANTEATPAAPIEVATPHFMGHGEPQHLRHAAKPVTHGIMGVAAVVGVP